MHAWCQAVTRQTQVQVPVVTSSFFGLLGGLNREGNSCPRHASMALALSAHTPRVQLSVYHVSASWHSKLGQDTPRRYLAISWNTCKLSLLCMHGVSR